MPIIGIVASSGTPRETGAFESIATVNVGGGGASFIEFTSIPQTYTHLQIRAISRNDRGGDIQQTFELEFGTTNTPDTDNNYSYHRFMGDGSSASATGGGLGPDIYLYFGSASNATGSNIFGASIWDILDYSSTSKFKMVRYLGGIENNGAGTVNMGDGYWANSGAISYIRISLSGGNSNLVNSQYALYGIKA
jgi:hypothetical protein